MPRNNSVQDGGLFSDEDLQDWLAGEVTRFLNVERKMTREMLAQASHVSIHMIDAIRKRDEGRRKLSPAQVLSLCCVMGQSRINGMLAHIGYGGATPLDEADELNVNELVASGLQHFTIIATAAADGRIDHTEAPACQEAADEIIATFLPLSSAGKAG